jgi:hypothetical protein
VRLKKEIEAEIAKLQEELEEANIYYFNKIIRNSSSYSDQEKIKIFNMLHMTAINIFRDVEENNYIEEVVDANCFELIMDLIAKDDDEFWSHFRSLLKFRS